MSSDWLILTKLRWKLLRGCYTQSTFLATLRKVEGRSTFLATRNATIAVAKWGVTRKFFPATCNATFVALQVARKIASCNMALSDTCFPVHIYFITNFFFTIKCLFGVGTRHYLLDQMQYMRHCPNSEIARVHQLRFEWIIKCNLPPRFEMQLTTHSDFQ